MKFKVKSLDNLESLGFVRKDFENPDWDPVYVYDAYGLGGSTFLCINSKTKEIEISSGFDYVNGTEELEGFYKLIKAGLVMEDL